MTDNTQELDEILLRLWMGDEWLKQFNSEPVKQKPRFIEAKQAILDWHNKQIEGVLDRLDLSMRGKTIVDTAEGWQRFVKRHVQGAIEAERNKLEAEL